MKNILKNKNLLSFLKNPCFKNSFFTMALIFAGVFFMPLAESTNESDKIHICFFELDNTKTSQNFKGRVTKQKMKGCPKVKEAGNMMVYCYQPRGGDNAESGGQGFERMIKEMKKEGQKCDALVFSGHHTGDWFGKTGTLWLKDIEALSCKEEYKNWFQNIKALWLDGCNTITDNFIQSSGIIKSPDSETVRVVEKEVEDKTKLSRNYMNMFQQSYAGSLDENTPLSSRYLRMFPNTQIYGFNGAAPEGNTMGQTSFIYNHLTKLGQALKSETEFNNVSDDFTRGLKAMFSEDLCDPEKIEAWEKAGWEELRMQGIEHQDYTKAYQLGCDLILAKQVLDNPKSSEAQKALARQIINDPKYKGTDALKLANKILENPNSKEAVQLAKLSVVNTLKAVNEMDRDVTENDKTFSHILFNNIYDTWNTAKKYKNRDSDFFDDVQSEFKKKSFTKSLEERITSPYTASLRKGDYIKFYTDVHDVNINKSGKKAKFVKTEIDKLVKKASSVFEDLKSPRQLRLNLETKRVLAVSVVDQLVQYQLLSVDQMDQLMNNKKLFPEERKNPFILDTWMRLKFTAQPDQIFSEVKKEANPPTVRHSAIRIGASIYLDQFDTKQSRYKKAKKQLAELAKQVDVNNIKQGTDSYAFYKAIHIYLQGSTDQKKADFLLDISEGTGKHLEKIVVKYASSILKDESARQQFCERLIKEIKGTKRKIYEVPDYCPTN